jgi:hypothetical protein
VLLGPPLDPFEDGVGVDLAGPVGLDPLDIVAETVGTVGPRVVEDQPAVLTPGESTLGRRRPEPLRGYPIPR